MIDSEGPSRRSTLRAACLTVTIGALAGLVVALARLHIDRSPTTDAGASNLRHLWPLWIASGAAWLGLTGVAWTLRGRRGRRRTGRAAHLALLLGVALAARIAVLIVHEPTLSDDIHRYVLDGRTLAAGFNPYMDTPAARREALTRGEPQRFTGEADLLLLVNNAEMHTIYLPASQWCFALAGLVTVDAWSGPRASGRVFRAGLVLVELGVILMLLAAARRARRSQWWVALYAWHPIAITEIAGSGHQDVLGIALLVASLLLYGSWRRRTRWWTTILALGALVKPVVVPVAGLMLRGRPPREWRRSAVWGALICAAVSAPLLLTHGAEPASNWWQTTSRFSRKWAHFGSVYEPVLSLVETVTNDPDDWRREPDGPGLWSNDAQEILARGLCIASLGVVILVLLSTKLEIWAAARVLFFAMLLLSSTAHPWYLLWALVLWTRAPTAAVWVASLTLPWGYAQFADVIDWHTSAWVMWLAYVPVYVVLVIDVVQGRGLGIEPRRRGGAEGGSG